MTTIFIVILFVIQIISFYFLALLYTKVSNFDDLEKKQRKLMEEMDDSITAYLTELKDENDRLINQLSVKVDKTDRKQRDKITDSVLDLTNEKNEKKPLIDVTTPVIPLNIALKSYGKTNLHKTEQESPEEQLEADDRTRALRLHDAGESIEEIAKILGKGRTEVELILKFR